MVVDGLQRLGFGSADDDALARRQAVGLDHQRRAHFPDVFGRLFGGDEALARGGGNPVFEHQRFGEGFARLDFRRRAGRTENPESRGLEGIHDARGKRSFGAHDRQVDSFAPGEFDQGRNILRVDVHAGGHFRDAAVSGRAEYLFHPGALSDLPDQGVLSAAAADYQNFHVGKSPFRLSSGRNRARAAWSARARSTSRSRSAANSMPAARAARGSRLVGVMPGMVLVSSA
jgi:hypothetical protein